MPGLPDGVGASRASARLRCYLSVALANAVSHPVLVRHPSVSSGEVIRLCMSVLTTIPAPSARAVLEDPVACLRCDKRRMAAVSILGAMKHVLAALGLGAAGLTGRMQPRARIQSPRARLVKPQPGSLSPPGGSVEPMRGGDTAALKGRSPHAPLAPLKLPGTSGSGGGPERDTISGHPPSPRPVRPVHEAVIPSRSAAALSPLSPLEVLDRVMRVNGAENGSQGLASLLDHLVDLLSWVDFVEEEDVTSGVNAGWLVKLEGVP